MTSTDHRAEAIDALALIQASDNPVAEMSSASEATAHALLAIEARLGEIAEQLHTANVIAAYGALSEYESLEEDIATTARLREVLGLIFEGPSKS